MKEASWQKRAARADERAQTGAERRKRLASRKGAHLSLDTERARSVVVGRCAAMKLSVKRLEAWRWQERLRWGSNERRQVS